MPYFSMLICHLCIVGLFEDVFFLDFEGLLIVLGITILFCLCGR